MNTDDYGLTAPHPLLPGHPLADHRLLAADTAVLLGREDRWHAPAPGVCHLWLVPVQPAAGPLDLLTDAEQDRLARLFVEHARNTFVTSRTAQRLIGSRYLGVRPDAVTITRDCQYCGPAIQHGRPRFGNTAIEYSVSHTEDWVLMALTGAGVVGADIESFASSRDTESLVRIALTADEQAELHRLPAGLRSAKFFSAWTRKEAAMKLTGLGLRAAPNQLDVRGTTVGVGAIAQWPAVPVYLYDLPSPAGHAAALASTVPVTAVRSFALSGLQSALPHLAATR